MSNRVVVVFGATRGIGREIAIKFSTHHWNVVVSGKTVEDAGEPHLQGTIHSVAREIQEAQAGNAAPGVKAIAVKCDVRNAADVSSVFEQALRQFGRIDCVVYNAGAILWNKVADTSLKRFELMIDINLRGFYAVIQQAIPLFTKQQFGRIITIAPPIYSRFTRGKTPYAATKYGMSSLVIGLGHEWADTPFAISGLWPATGIESAVTIKLKSPPHLLRTADVMAEACYRIALDEPRNVNGLLLIDEDYLRSKGVADAYFQSVRCDPAREPPRMMPKRFPNLMVDEEMGEVFAANSLARSKL